MKRSSLRKSHPLQSKLSLLCALSVACSSASWAQTPAPSKPLTQAELLKQIKSWETTGGEANGKPASGAARAQSSGPTNLLPGFKDSASEKKAAPKKEGGSKEKKSSGPTEITALEATFDQKNHLAIFTKEVVLQSPDFDLTCDRLTAYLKNSDAAAATTEKPPVAPGGEDKSGGLDRVIAEGNVVITQEKTEVDGTLTRSVGRSQKAIYNASTGDTVLTGRPEVQQGINTIIATADNTTMTMKKGGDARVQGPHKTVIRDKMGEK